MAWWTNHGPRAIGGKNSVTRVRSRQQDPQDGSRSMSKQRLTAAVLMVAFAATAMFASDGAWQASAAPVTSLTFSPSVIALENDSDTAVVDIVVAGLLADEADTVQINIQHGSDVTISAAPGGLCGPLYAGGFSSSVTAVTGGSAFLCSLQNGPDTSLGGNVVASIEITKVGETTGLSPVTFLASGSFRTTFFEAGSEVEVLPGVLGTLDIWDLLVAPIDRSVAEGAGPLIFDVTTTAEGSIPTLSATVNGSDIGLFPFITFVDNADPALTGTFTVNPTFDDAGVYTIAVTADNGTSPGNGLGTETFTVTVTEMNRAPVLTTVFGDQSVAEGDTLDLFLTATDDDGDGLTFSATVDTVAVPTGFATLTPTGAGTATLSFSPDFSGSDLSPYDIVVTVTDDSTAPNGALDDSEAFALTVTNTNRNPVITAIADTDVDEGGSLDVLIVASDPDGQIPTLSATIDGQAVPDLFATITPTGDGTATLSFNPAFGETGVYSIVVTADDGATGTSTEPFQLTVNDVASIVAPAGTVTLQGLPDRATSEAQHDLQFAAIAPLVELVRVSDGGVEASVSVAVDGSFAFNGVPTNDTYRLRISAAGYFIHELGTLPADEIDVSGGDYDVGPVTMLGGLVVPGITVVEGNGITLILLSLFTTPVNGRLDGGGNVVDINGDGAVEIGDVSTAISNFGLSGTQPWS